MDHRLDVNVILPVGKLVKGSAQVDERTVFPVESVSKLHLQVDKSVVVQIHIDIQTEFLAFDGFP